MIDIRQGDCLDVMRDLPDASVDMILCDLPYGVTRNNWDMPIDLDRMWSEVWRVCRGAALFNAQQPFTSALVLSGLSSFRCEWVWEKNKASGHLNAKHSPMRAHEVVLVFGEGAVTYNPQMVHVGRPANFARTNANSTNYGHQRSVAYGGSKTRYPRTVQRFNVVDNISAERVHPTQKPVPLCEYLIRTYSNPGETVLDFCMGSGTTGVACLNTGRRFIGIEQDPHYFEVARDRLARVEAELTTKAGGMAAMFT